MAIDLRNKRISIIGAGRSGTAVAEVVRSSGGIPFVSDSGECNREKVSRLEKMGIDFECGRHSSKVYKCDFMVVSPGVPSNADIIIKARSIGLTVWPEVELAYRICKGKVIGITGSNGKTTTTTLIGEILRRGGKEVAVCGNIGSPFIASAADISPDGFAVVELSSFQLELIEDFEAHVAVFLNITPDHLDRHGDFKSYFAAKTRIFENQEADDFAVVNYDDSILREKGDIIKSRISWFSTSEQVPNGIWGDTDGDLIVGGKAVIKSNELKIKGTHNLSNACAATGAALNVGVKINDIAEALKSFPGVEHRLEPVRLIGGVSFINDSKGTNVDSVRWALLAVSAPVILIAGGKDKGGDFSALNELIAEKVKAVILIGLAARKILKEWESITKCVSAGDMNDAVRIAFDLTIEGDTVLLSPGCASFDMFENFEHRGRVFKTAVVKLASREVAG
ncbi:MAG: UDP-N-acetylmuramoyl-L-alanine--D-glutamate ligase [candidate division Zixibacteria bacterium]